MHDCCIVCETIGLTSVKPIPVLYIIAAEL